jgi:hypothetical protein
MKTRRREEKPMRKAVTTTFKSELWRNLQIQALTEGRDVNEILEELAEAYLKRKGVRK